MSRHSLRKQIASRGYFAEIVLTATFIEDSKLQGIDIGFKNTCDKTWQEACKCGAYLFREYFMRPGRLEITFEEVNWLPVDTNFLIVVYTTVKAIEEELHCTSEVRFDEEAIAFIFPERRTML